MEVPVGNDDPPPASTLTEGMMRPNLSTGMVEIFKDGTWQCTGISIKTAESYVRAHPNDWY